MADLFEYPASEDNELSQAMHSYIKCKQALGFESWGVEEICGKLCVMIDNVNINIKFKDIKPDFEFGELLKVVPLGEDDDCCHVQGTRERVILTLSDFQPVYGTVGYEFCKHSVYELCRSVEQEILRRQSLRLDTQSSQVDCTRNILIENAERKRIGTYKVPIERLHHASDRKKVRNMYEGHIKQLVELWSTEIRNKREISLRPAVGIARSLDTFMTDEIEVIDGNHTLAAAKRLLDIYPNETSLRVRDVVIYTGLTESEALTIGLLNNEEACLTLPTSQLEEVRIMRGVLKRLFNGRMSQGFLEHLYEMFNCININDKKKLTRRKKEINERARVCTMDDRLWDHVYYIEKIRGGSTKMYKYCCLSSKTVDSSLEILEDVKAGRIRYGQLQTKLRLLPDATNDQRTALQRIRQPKKRSSNEENEVVSVPGSTLEAHHQIEVEEEDEMNLNESVQRKLRKTRHELQECTQQNEYLQEELKEAKTELKQLRARNSKLQDHIQAAEKNKVNVEVLNEVQEKLNTTLNDLEKVREENRRLQNAKMDDCRHSVPSEESDQFVRESMPFPVCVQPTSKTPDCSQATKETVRSKTSSNKENEESQKLQEPDRKRARLNRKQNEMFKHGQMVKALFRYSDTQEEWYDATVESVLTTSNTYKVRFEDGAIRFLKCSSLKASSFD